MSNNNQDWFEDDEFDFEDDVEETPQRQQSGNDVVKKLRRAERAKDKQLKEALAELESLKQFKRESLVSRVLQEKGVNPGIAKFLPSDIDMSEESISSWLTENGELFGVTTSNPKATINEEDMSALRQIDAATSNALSPDGVNDAYSAINNAQSAEELLSLIYGAE